MSYRYDGLPPGEARDLAASDAQEAEDRRARVLEKSGPEGRGYGLLPSERTIQLLKDRLKLYSDTSLERYQDLAALFHAAQRVVDGEGEARQRAIRKLARVVEEIEQKHPGIDKHYPRENPRTG